MTDRPATDKPAQLPLELPHREALEFQDFLVADCNRDAVAWLDRWPDWPAHGLAVYGPAASGKTHLAYCWAQKAEALIVRAEDLQDVSVVPLIAEQNLAVVVDAAAPDQLDPETLLHLYNHLKEQGGFLLMTSQEAPARWGLALKDLQSRLSAIPSVAVEQPDEALLTAILVKLFADRQLKVGQDVVTYVIPRLDRSFAAVNGFVAALDKEALAQQRAITVPLARSLLSKLQAQGEGLG